MQLQYEKAQRRWEKGKISKAELDALRPDVILRLRSATAAESVVAEAAVMTVITGKGFSKVLDKTPSMPAVRLSEDDLAQIAALRQAQAEIDKRKGELSNSLGDYPKGVSVAEICNRILLLRDDWIGLSKQIKAIEMGNSATISDHATKESLTGLALHEAIVASLPTDKYELKTKERNLVALLSKDRGKLRAAKDAAKKQELTVKIQQAELVLAAMRERLR
jgi:hypothetical protein